jgi:hypothetical protein
VLVLLLLHLFNLAAADEHGIRWTNAAWSPVVPERTAFDHASDARTGGQCAVAIHEAGGIGHTDQFILI